MTPPIGQGVNRQLKDGTWTRDAVIQKRIGDEQFCVVWNSNLDRKKDDDVWNSLDIT